MPLAKLNASWTDYVRHLQILAAWLVPLEQWLANYQDGPQGKQALEFICYSKFILRDLGDDFLQSAVMKINHTDRFNQARWQAQENTAYRWGISYVIEGSQLGGEFLYQRLSTKLAPHPLHYLKPKQTGRWPTFLQALAVNVITPTDIDSACAGAVDAFDALLQQLPVREKI